jgi:putative DNA primase/helicase
MRSPDLPRGGERVTLAERLNAAGWPASPNGRGTYVRCPSCQEGTVLVDCARDDGSIPANTSIACPSGCTPNDVYVGLRALLEPRRRDEQPRPREWPDPGKRRTKAHTDDGNAQRFAGDWADDVRHVIGVGWHLWDGRRWRPDDDGGALRRARVTARVIVDEASHLGNAAADKDDEKAAKAHMAHGMRSQNAPKLKAMLELAQTETRLVLDADQLDADPFALCVGTGILNLRTGELHPHDRAQRITHLVPIAYDPDAECPRWERFLADVLGADPDLITYVQRAVGYSLTGDTREQVAFLLHGDGANGKSTLLNTLVGMLGSHGATADPRSFTLAGADRAARSDLARLRGRRLVAASELPPNAQLDEDLLKRITGGERITARFNYGTEFEFTPALKLWMAVNHLPTIEAGGHAVWRRLRVIPMRTRITAPDLELGRRLHDELPGILAWAIRGCVTWQTEGLGTCAAVEDATAAYRREQDAITEFLADRTTRSPSASVEFSELHEAYHEWAAEHDITLLDGAALGTALTRLGIRSGKSNGKRTRKGITLC